WRTGTPILAAQREGFDSQVHPRAASQRNVNHPNPTTMTSPASASDRKRRMRKRREPETSRAAIQNAGAIRRHRRASTNASAAALAAWLEGKEAFGRRGSPSGP